MAIQQTPPPGWPHTEAEKYKTHIYPEAPTQKLSHPGENMPAGSVEAPTHKRRSGCGCFVTTMIIIAILGVLVAVLVPILDDQGISLGESTTESAAQSAFLEEYPEWDVEVVDRPDSDPGSFRIVAWNYARNIGRIVLMDENDNVPWGYAIRSITGDGARTTDEALLDAFSDSWSEEGWAYIHFAEPIDQTPEAEIWNVSYRLWYEATEEWSDIYETPALRVSSDKWYVAGPDGVLPASAPETETTVPQ